MPQPGSLRRLLRRPGPAAGLLLTATFASAGLLAPLLANDAPIVARAEGGWYAPVAVAVAERWAPEGAADALRRLAAGGRHPLHDAPPELAGGWVEADLALWPPVPWHPTRFDRAALGAPPSADHWLGADELGGDVLSRLLHGAATSAQVGLVAVGLAAAIGASLGLAAGWLGGWADLALSRVAEVVACFPTFFLLLAVLAVLGPSQGHAMLVLGLVGWPDVFRLVRGEVIALRGRDHVTAAVALGLPGWRVALRHVLPAALPPVVIALPYLISAAMLAEASLSFLGLADPFAPSWGAMAWQGRRLLDAGAWHLAVFPGAALFAAVVGLQLLAGGLREEMDPRTRVG